MQSEAFFSDFTRKMYGGTVVLFVLMKLPDEFVNNKWFTAD